MDMKTFAQNIVQAANEGQVTLLPISSRDKAKGCIINFRLGTEYRDPLKPTHTLKLRVFWAAKAA